ncbi:MAG TPA: M1 family metallopeptidase [Caulobacterales bacterium]|nr:M1 family metallopeptidase [Caulobacterales bacterium]
MRFMVMAAALFGALALSASADEQQSQRQVLPAGVTPLAYHLTVTPNAPEMTLAGDVSIDISVAAPTNVIVLNALELTFDTVTLDNRARPQVSFDAEAQTARLTFDRPVSAGQHTLRIAYHGKIYRAAQGMFAYDYQSDHGAERVLTTQFEAADARRFLPCFDQPDMKATWEVSAVVPQDRVVISNMPVAGTDQLAQNQKRVRFAATPKMSSYLLFMGVGDFERITASVDGVEIGVVTKRGDTEQGRFALQSAVELLHYYNDYFGTPYPLPKLDLIAVPGGGGFSAMENWGAILYFENALLVDPNLSSERNRQTVYVVVAHEMAHQWFGDLVTMAWWDDIWLNEGFASWMERKVTEHFHPDWNTWMQGARRQQEAMDLDARATSHPIVQEINTVDEANNAFDRITYEKSRNVLRMIEAHIGEDRFRDGVRAYMAAHKFGNARTAELWSAIEASSGQNIHDIMTDFTTHTGVPLMTVEAGPCQNRTQRTITVRQGRFGLDQASRAPQSWRTPVHAQLIGSDGAGGAVTENGTASFTLPGCGAFVLNPSMIGYYRTQYAPADFDQIVAHFGEVRSADQLGLLYDSHALAVAGTAPYDNVLRLAERTPRDADPIVWVWVASELTLLDRLYSDTPNQENFRIYARGILNPVFRQVGWDKHSGEAANVSVLRERLVSALSILADPTFEAEALRRFNADQIPGELHEEVLNAVGRAANEATFNALLAKARATTDTLEKEYYYDALAHARDPALAQRALELAFDDDVAAALGTEMIGVVANGHTRMAWDFSVAHSTELGERLDPLSKMRYLPGLAVGSMDPSVAPLLRNYIDTQLPPELRRTGESFYLRLNEGLRLRTEIPRQVDHWLTTRRRS